MVDGNAYITIGDPFQDHKANPFRQPKKGEKAPTPFQIKVELPHFLLYFLHVDDTSKCGKW